MLSTLNVFVISEFVTTEPTANGGVNTAIPTPPQDMSFDITAQQSYFLIIFTLFRVSRIFYPLYL